MGIKAFNHGDDFVNKFIRAIASDSTGSDAVNPVPVPVPDVPGLTATGGVISDYSTPPGDVYRAHVFTTTGTFLVTGIGDFGSTVDYLVVAGGGGGGGGPSAAGG